MSVYFSGKKCSVCNIAFSEEDDVVFCPVCGAPHHRECWSGQCAFHEKHGTSEQWSEVEQPESQKTASDDNVQSENQSQNGKAITCVRCGRINFPAGDKCVYCGNRLDDTKDFDPLGEKFPKYSFIYDPLGGVDPYEEIDGVKAGELAEFVTANTVRYIPRFSKMSKGKNRVSWNWAAFLIPGYWFLYRKCYAQGIFVMLISIISELLSTPYATWLMNNTSEYGGMMQMLNISADIPVLALILYYVAINITLILNVLCGLFGDNIYRKHCIAKIKDLKSHSQKGDNVIPGAILKAKKGGVAFFAPLIGYTLYRIVALLLISLLK